MGTIFIEGLQVEAIIGVYAHERYNKQRLIVDLEMDYDCQQTCVSDNLKYALDYHTICTDVHAFIAASNFQLIESLAQAIATKILNNQQVQQVRITVSKPQALKQAKNVGIKMVRSQS